MSAARAARLLGHFASWSKRKLPSRHAFVLGALIVASASCLLLSAGAAGAVWPAAPQRVSAPTEAGVHVSATVSATALPLCKADWTSQYSCLRATGYAGQSVWGSWGPGHNCVSYAAYRLQKNGVTQQPWSPIGNAVDWKAAAMKKYGNAVANGTPAIGAIAWWGGEIAQGAGHVAYVESYTSSSIIVSEDSYITATSGYDDVEQIARGTKGWPDAFLHIKDADLVPPSKPTNLQVGDLSTSPQVNLTWGASTDNAGGSGLGGYSIAVNGTTVGSVGPTSTSYTAKGLNCGVTNSFAVSAYDNSGNTSPAAMVANVLLTACLKAGALNHIVSVSGGGSYYYDSSGLRALDDTNTYWCLIDQGRPVFTVGTQAIANALGSGKPNYPECLSLRRLWGHTVRNTQTGASYIVTDNSTPHGVWHWEKTGGVYQCLISTFSVLNADTTEIESLRQSGFYDGANADCPPATPTDLSITGLGQTALTLNWHPGANDDSFTLYRNGSALTTLSPGSQSSYTFTGLSCSASYTLAVRATNTIGLNSAVGSAVRSTAACNTVSVSLSGAGAGRVTSSIGGLNCTSSCAVGSYVQGMVVTLTQAAGPQSGFWDWSGPCSGAGLTCTFAINGNVSVGVTFVQTWTIQSLATGKYVTAEVNYGGSDYGLLRAQAGSVSTWEKFVVNGNCSTGCSFQSLENHEYVSTELNYPGNSYAELRARNNTWSGWETFTWVGNCSSICAIKSHQNGQYVAAEFADSGSYYGRLRARTGSWSGSPKAWESFKIVRG